jgi:hypothetical protein
VPDGRASFGKSNGLWRERGGGGWRLSSTSKAITKDGYQQSRPGPDRGRGEKGLGAEIAALPLGDHQSFVLNLDLGKRHGDEEEVVGLFMMSFTPQIVVLRVQAAISSSLYVYA